MKTALTIAGSDCSGGAGIQADLKTFAAHKVYGMSAITALTAQNTMGVSAISESAPDFLNAQLRAVFTDIVPDAGELPSGDSSDSPNSISPHNDDNDVPVSKAPVETSAPAEADPEIAADENHHQEKENIKKPAPGIRHHNVDKGKIAALRKAGWSYDKIADEMGLTKSAVTNIIFKMRKSGEYDI